MTDAPFTRLMLVTPELAETGAFLPVLEATLTAGDVAAVVIRLAPADDRTRLARAEPVIEAIQGAGAAALIAGEAVEDIVGKSGADGVHLVREADAGEATERFRPAKIVGVAVTRSRDGAMEAGEAGADYLMFGLDGSGQPWPAAETLERVQWWAEIFETPCVGFAGRLEDVAALAAARAEFVALGDAVWRHEAGPAEAVAAASAALSPAEAPAP